MNSGSLLRNHDLPGVVRNVTSLITSKHVILIKKPQLLWKMKTVKFNEAVININKQAINKLD